MTYSLRRNNPIKPWGRTKKRTKRAKVHGIDYTNPWDRDIRSTFSAEIGPLGEVLDPVQFKKFKAWMADEKYENVYLGLIVGTHKLFQTLLTPREWLYSEELDAAFNLIRERSWNFPERYGVNFTIEEVSFAQKFNENYEKFKMGKEEFNFDQDFCISMVGDTDKFKRSWEFVQDTYYTLNVDDTHWVLCAINFPSGTIKVYDCDQSLYYREEMDEVMEPVCHMLPYMMAQVGLPREAHKNVKALKPFKWSRRRAIPNTKISGDCGIFVIKHLECLISNKDISKVTDKHMNFWRRKLCVDLFHHNLEP